MAPTTQKALVLPHKFGEFMLETAWPVPKLPAGKLLIKVESVGLTPADWKIQRYGIIVDAFPAVIGLNIAGDVVEVGEGVTGFKIGDRVFLAGEFKSEYSAFQEYALADPFTTAIIPDDWSYDEASTIPCELSTAYLGLYEPQPRGLGLESIFNPGGTGAYAGEAIFVSGASSTVGQSVIQLAKISGFSFIITTSSLKHKDFLKSLGATHVIDRNLSLEAILAEIKNIPGVPNIKFAYDTIGLIETSFAVGVGAISPGGTVVTVHPELQWDSQDGKILSKIISNKDIPFNVEALRKLTAGAKSLFEKKLVLPARYEVVPGGLAGIPEGLKKLESGQVSGTRLVVRINETA